MNTRQLTTSLMCFALLLGSGAALAEQPPAEFRNAIATPAWQERVQERLQDRLDRKLNEDMDRHFAERGLLEDSDTRLAEGDVPQKNVTPQPILHDTSGRQRITLPAGLLRNLRSRGASLI